MENKAEWNLTGLDLKTIKLLHIYYITEEKLTLKSSTIRNLKNCILLME